MKLNGHAFQYSMDDQEEYEIDVEANGIRADIDSHNEKSVKLNVFHGARKAASPLGMSKGMSSSQISSSYQMVEHLNLDHEDLGSRSPGPVFARAPNMDFNHQNLRPFQQQPRMNAQFVAYSMPN